MTTGIPFKPNKTEMDAAIIYCRGNIQKLAKKYSVNPDTIYQYLYKNPETKAHLEYCRGYNVESMLDYAESIHLMNMMSYEKNATLAQRAAEKVIDGLGHHRGWHNIHSETSIPLNQEELDKDHVIMMQANRLSELEAKLANQPQAE